MCRQIFTYKESYPDMTEELANLKTLIDGHRVMRERYTEDNQEFEAFEEET